MGENSSTEVATEKVGVCNQIIDIITEEVDLNDYPEFETNRVYGWELVRNSEDNKFTVAFLLEGEELVDRSTLLSLSHNSLCGDSVYRKFQALLKVGERQEVVVYQVDEGVRFSLNSFGCSKCPRYTPVYVDIESEDLILKIEELLRAEGRSVIEVPELYES